MFIYQFCMILFVVNYVALFQFKNFIQKYIQALLKFFWKSVSIKIRSSKHNWNSSPPLPPKSGTRELCSPTFFSKISWFKRKCDTSKSLKILYNFFAPSVTNLSFIHPNDEHERVNSIFYSYFSKFLKLFYPRRQ